MSNSICYLCGNEIPAGDSVCPVCGVDAPADTGSPMPPKNTGSEIPVDEYGFDMPLVSLYNEQQNKKDKSKKKSTASTTSLSGSSNSAAKFIVPITVLAVCLIAVIAVAISTIINQEEIRRSYNSYDDNDYYSYNSDYNDYYDNSNDYYNNSYANTYEPEHSYSVIAADVSWFEAKAECERRGGHLATITSQEEYDKICSLANNSDLRYIWLGARIYSASDSFNEWITGEPINFTKWYPGEPSKADVDGTEEFYLCMWNIKYDGMEMGWTFNDQRNDLLTDESVRSGSVGYVIEYEN